MRVADNADSADAADTETPPSAWHTRPLDDVFEDFDVTREGLSADEAARRLERFGPNSIREEDGISPAHIFVAQFQDFLIYLLVVAAALSMAVGLLPGNEPNYVDTGLILLILLANGVFGFVQDYRAEKSMQALRELATPEATVVRDGERRRVDASTVVPGDVVAIEQGDTIPADARLVETASLEVDESALTGESESVPKATEPVAADAPLADRRNMAYMNTNAVKGRGLAVVVSTGMETEVGGIATQIREADEPETPFQAEVNQLGKQIGLGVVGLILLVAATQYAFTAASPLSILLVGVTLAVAAVPEGLPAIVTLTLALGSRQMLEQNALVRRLPVVESMGSVDAIVTDKTGTLTENRMTVQHLYAGGDTYTVSGRGTRPVGEFSRDGEPVDAAAIQPLLQCGATCNNAEPAPTDDDRAYYGDPTEIALLVSATKADVEAAGTRVRELPFTSDRKRMTVLVEADGETRAYTKGAPEVILDRCDRVLVDGTVHSLTEEHRQAVLDANEQFAADALRVLGFARKSVDDPDADADDVESGLVFLGLQAMIDPPRDGVAEAVEDCRNAGIRVTMATGDNVATARAIGSQVGFDPSGAMTGPELESLSDAALRDVVDEVEVFARVSPDHKVRILRAHQANDRTVAMTGDGVNDAPALRNADVGISMGIRGTDVAQQASDMVLQDDNFVTIRNAIAEGRGIFDNIRKFVNYLLSANAGEVLVVFFGVLVGSFLFPGRFASESEALILTPVMLLWINLVTDGLPALALGADPKAEGILSRPPRPPDEPVISARMLVSIVSIGVVMAATGLVLFFHGLRTVGDLVLAQTVLFTFLVTVEVVRIQVIRRRYDLSLLSNPWLVAAIAVTILLQAAVLYTPLNAYFEVSPLDGRAWTWIGAAFLGFLALNVSLEWLYDRVLAGGTPGEQEPGSASTRNRGT